MLRPTPQLNDIGGETSFADFRPNLIQMWNDEPHLNFYDFTPAQMFNHIWCNLAQYFYIRGEKHKDTMKYFVLIERDKEYIWTILYIHPDFLGASQQIVARALIDLAEITGEKSAKAAFYTTREVKPFERLFRKMGVKHLPAGDYTSGNKLIRKCLVDFGADFNEAYGAISICQGHTKGKR